MRQKKPMTKRPGGTTLDEDQINSVLSEQKLDEKSVLQTQQQPMMGGYDCDDDDPEDDDQSQQQSDNFSDLDEGDGDAMSNESLDEIIEEKPEEDVMKMDKAPEKM